MDADLNADAELCARLASRRLDLRRCLPVTNPVTLLCETT
jgi:hypothetical protein